MDVVSSCSRHEGIRLEDIKAKLGYLTLPTIKLRVLLLTRHHGWFLQLLTKAEVILGD